MSPDATAMEIWVAGRVAPVASTGDGAIPGCHRAVFLDRDGVLVRLVRRGDRWTSPRSIADFDIVEGARQSLTRLRGRGFLLVVLTNQRDVADGQLPAGTLWAMHCELRRVLPLDLVVACVGDRDSDYYKPKPGMLDLAAQRLRIDPARSYVVGDRWRDIDLGAAAGATTIQVRSPASDALSSADHRVADIVEAVQWIEDRETSEERNLQIGAR